MKNVNSHKSWSGGMHGRKGVIDVQFNWIFILIAGFVIFLFIIGIVFSQKKHADTQSSITTLNHVTTIFSGKQQAANVYSEVSIPSASMEFRCEMGDSFGDGYFTFKMGGTTRKELATEIMFAPASITSSTLELWGQEFDIGMPVTTFTYITTPNSIIIIYSDTNTPGVSARTLYDSLPDNITKKITTDISGYKDYKHVRIVCFDAECPASDSGMDYLKVNDLGGYGTVGFYEDGSLEKELPFITYAGLYGAIFSDTPEYYECQMSRALKQFNTKSRLMRSRTEYMIADMGDGNCKNVLRAALDEMADAEIESFNLVEITEAYTFIKGMDTRSAELEIGSCPKIY